MLLNSFFVAYNDMQHRKEERENMWQIPGWDDCVAATGRSSACDIVISVKFILGVHKVYFTFLTFLFFCRTGIYLLYLC